MRGCDIRFACRRRVVATPICAICSSSTLERGCWNVELGLKMALSLAITRILRRVAAAVRGFRRDPLSPYGLTGFPPSLRAASVLGRLGLNAPP